MDDTISDFEDHNASPWGPGPELNGPVLDPGFVDEPSPVFPEDETIDAPSLPSEDIAPTPTAPAPDVPLAPPEPDLSDLPPAEPEPELVPYPEPAAAPEDGYGVIAMVDAGEIWPPGPRASRTISRTTSWWSPASTMPAGWSSRPTREARPVTSWRCRSLSSRVPGSTPAWRVPLQHLAAPHRRQRRPRSPAPTEKKTPKSPSPVCWPR